MSFSHIDYLTPNRPTLIKEDLLVSLMEVDSINESVSALESNTPNWNEINSIPDRLNRISDVYNQNIDFVTEKLKSFNFRKTLPSMTRESINNSTDLAKFKEECTAQLISCEEHAQYAQIARVCDHLKKKIETLNGRIDRYLSSHPTVRIPHFAVTALHNSPTEYTLPLHMRELDRPIMIQPCSGNNPATELPATTIEVMIISSLGGQINDRPVRATVKCEVGEGNVLGICCAPTWGVRPIAFTKSVQDGWVGGIPSNVEFKFVILSSNGQVQQWEQGQNRKLPLNNPALVLTSNQVQF